MKKTIALLIVLLLTQLTVLAGGIWATISVRGDCNFVPKDLGMWQCSGDTDPIEIPLIAFVVLSPVLARIVYFVACGRWVSWKRVLVAHVVLGLLALGTLNALDTISAPCGCGG